MKFKGEKSERGAWAEQQAAHYLEQQGLIVNTRNYLCKSGEIDLVMNDGELLVFIEVRQRNSQYYGSAIETVDRRKQRKLIRAARHYLQKFGLTERVACRFDVIGVETSSETAVPHTQSAKITWVRDAFRLDWC